jgi:hypothetical protein
MKSDDAFYDCDCGGSLISEKSCRILLLHFVYMVQVLRICTRGGLRVKPAVPGTKHVYVTIYCIASSCQYNILY